MIDPNNMQRTLVTNDNVDIIVIPHLPDYDIKDYDLFDDKSFKKFVADVEKCVRQSMEYRDMVSYLRDNMNMNACSFYKNVTNIESFKIRIELHHTPFSLYDITIIVINKRMMYHESLEVEVVAKEIMFLHYKLLVGLIPVSETVHELIHNNYLFVPADKVFGNYKEFIAMYEDFMTAEQHDVLNRVLEFTKTYNEAEDVHNVLKKKYVYVDIVDGYELPVLESILSEISVKIDEIRSNVPVLDNKFDNNKIMQDAIEFIKEDTYEKL